MCYYAFGYGPYGRRAPWGYRDYGWGGTFRSVPVNITENEDSYEILLYAPALVKEGFRVTTKNDVLTIRYQTPEEEKAGESNYTLREYHPHSFERSFLLNNKVMVEELSATYREGILKVLLPKSPEANKPGQPVQIT
ncbi:MAG: Hsp20/alpha crystallin family protein [Flavisolibacter sp.]|nr:Hsp20/alpha crystallin family protein [Flavisolibacter sp.]MBD0295902.1 Hsp20/alpha crystallin family protein [Flavisolibacter sp.]MBD0351004.1 Hsp20/alpha crystallin family protein [Flavisolibacter sp.]MBD0364529.1 Hsp20/alpha crystallin family protein [Flavisolibacter sp.]